MIVILKLVYQSFLVILLKSLLYFELVFDTGRYRVRNLLFSKENEIHIKISFYQHLCAFQCLNTFPITINDKSVALF